MINNSGSWWYVSPTGQAIEGDNPPSGSTVLVAPGGQIEDALAKRHGIDGKLGGEPAVARSSSGEPLVRRDGDGRAFAAGVLPADDEGRRAAEEAAREEDGVEAEADVEAKADEPGDEDEPGVKAEAEGKAVRPDREGIEDKSVQPPRRGRPPGKK